MKKLIFFGLNCIFLFACSKFEVKDQDLPDINTIDPLTIETELPVINIMTDQHQFKYIFDHYLKDTSISGTVTFYDENRDAKLMAEPIKLAIEGNASAKYDMKSLGLSFSTPLNNQNPGIFNPPKIINDHKLDQFYALRLRSSGQDFGRTMIKDIAYTELAIQAGVDVELMYFQPAHVFINDSYYGLMNLRNENDYKGIAGFFNMDTLDITTIDSQQKDGDLEWEYGHEPLVNQFLQAIEERNYYKISTMMDVDAFIDYIIFQDYVGNQDWPNNNMRMHSVSGNPFRFMVYDMDYAAYKPKNPKLPELEYMESGIALLFQILDQDNGFRDRLEQRQKELYSRFSPEKFNTIVDRFAQKIEHDIPFLIAKYQKPESRFHWKMYLDALKREFESQDKYMRKKYDL